MRYGQAQVLDMVEHSGSSLGVKMCGHQFLGLIEQPNPRLVRDWRVHASLRTHLDVARARDWHVGVDDFAVHLDHVERNESFGLSTGADTHPGQSLGQPFSLVELCDVGGCDEVFDGGARLQRFLLLRHGLLPLFQLVSVDEVFAEPVEGLQLLLVLQSGQHRGRR